MAGLQVSLELRGVAEMMATTGAAPEVLKAEMAMAITRGTYIAEAEIKALTPRRTGRLFSGWSAIPAPLQLEGRVVNPVSYARIIEYGSKPHDIRPLTKKALMWKGAAHPVKVVHHPGTRAQHVAQRGLDRAKDRIMDEFRQAAKRALATIKGAA